MSDSLYTQEMLDSIQKVEATRPSRIGFEPRRMTAEEKEALLAKFHPDYKKENFDTLVMGPNKGERVPKELAALLQAHSRVKPESVDLEHPDYDVDVLVIGGGGAGSSAAIMAHENGANVMIVTKLRHGDANTMMAEGGIQAADKENDSPMIHYVDALGGGHFKNVPELLYKLVTEGPGAVKWLNDLGVMFDKEADGTMLTTHGGGTSRKRMHAAKDYSGAEIMRVLRDEVINRGIPVVDFTAAIELILQKDETYCKKFFVYNGLLKGYILVDKVQRGGIYTSLIREQIPLDTVDFDLLKENATFMAFSAEDRRNKFGGVV